MFDGTKLKKLREIKNLSLRDLEDLVGISFASLSDIENGVTVNPRQTTVDKICKGLKIDREYFYDSNSRLPTDIIPNMPPEIEKFIMDGENVPYLILGEKAKKNGIPPDVLEKIIELWTQK